MMSMAHNGEEASMSAKPIVAATDGSEESMRAVDWAVREAVLRGAPLRIVSAAALLPRMIGGHAMSGNDAEADTLRIKRDQALAAATERAAKIGPRPADRRRAWTASQARRSPKRDRAR